MRIPLHAIVLFLALLGCAGPAMAESITFPADAGVADVVRDFKAVGDGVADDTEALRKALLEKEGMIYFPNGTYLISDTLDWAGSINKVFQGQSRNGVVIKLKDACPGYQDAAKPKAMIRTGFPPAIRFRNAIRNLTIDCGNGNPGASALRFYVNNQGHVADVTIRSGADGGAPGAIGLALDQDMVGPLLIRNVEVIGFDIGVKVFGSVNSVTLEQVTLTRQRKVALLNDRNLVFARGLRTTGEVPAVVNSGTGATLCLVDAELRGSGAAGQHIAISNEGDRSVAYVRNAAVSGFAQAIRNVAEVVPAGTVTEWVSLPPAMLFPAEARSLGLPIMETPEVPWDADHATWANVCSFGANPTDKEADGEAIQKAIDSGASTIYFPQRTTRTPDGRIIRARYLIDRTISIRGKVRRLLGLESTFMSAPGIAEGQPLFLLEGSGGPVVIEHFMKQLGADIPHPFLRQASEREVIVRGSSGVPAIDVVGTGRVFIEDVCTNAVRMAPGTTLFARQLNIEGHEMKLENRGGTAWVLGFKTEPAGPIMHTSAKGRTEVLGGFFYTCIAGGQGNGTMITEDASATLAGAGEYAYTRAWGTQELMREIRAGETRSLQVGALPRRGGGSQFPLMVSHAAAAQGAAPGQPTADMVASTPGSLTLKVNASDPDGDVIGLEVRRDGTPPVDRIPASRVGQRQRSEQVCAEGAIRALVKPGQTCTDDRLRPDTAYTYTVVAFDRWNQRSPAFTLSLRTPPDTVPPLTPELRSSSRLSMRQVKLAWKRLSDEIGVTTWELSRIAGDQRAVIASGAGAEEGTFDDKTVQAGATYRYELVAIDAAGNRSQPSPISVTVPSEPAKRSVIQLGKPDRWLESYRGAGGRELGSLIGGGWVFYEDVDLAGPKGAFDSMTLRYGAPLPKHRPYLVLEVLHRPSVIPGEGEGALSSLEGGTLLGRFLCPATSGYQDYQDITLPIALPDAEPGAIAIRFIDGKANLLSLTFGSFDTPAKRDAAQADHQRVTAEYEAWAAKKDNANKKKAPPKKEQDAPVEEPAPPTP